MDRRKQLRNMIDAYAISDEGRTQNIKVKPRSEIHAENPQAAFD